MAQKQRERDECCHAYKDERGQAASGNDLSCPSLPQLDPTLGFRYDGGMRLRFLPIALAVPLALAAPRCAVARIGETEAQMMARLGKPNDDWLTEMPFGDVSGCTAHAYVKVGTIVCYAYFLQGKVVCEGYSKEMNAAFDPDELKALLAANAGESTWTEQTPTEGQSWQRSDKAARAQYPLGLHGMLLFCTPEFDTLLQRDHKAAVKKTTDGL